MAFTIVRDNLAHVVADAIVLPSDERLSLSGGVSAEVANAFGMMHIRRACRRIGDCPAGRAVAIPASRFVGRHLIFAVGPIWQEGSCFERQLLESAYEQALRRAIELNCRSVALPLISAGAFGFPPSVSLEIGMSVIRPFLDQHDIDITLCVYDKEAFSAAQQLLGQVASYIDDTYVEERYDQALRNCSYAQPMPAFESRSMTAPRLGSQSRRSSSAAPVPHADECAEAMVEESDAALKASAEASVRQTAMPHRAAGQMCEACGAVLEPGHRFCFQCGTAVGATSRSSLQDMLDSLDEPFSVTLMHLIDQRGLTDAQVYRRANMSRQLFAKIRGNADYRPTKKTVLALCVALELSLPETRDLLSRAGFSLTHTSKFDIIVEFFIKSGNYDIFAINQVLFCNDQQLLG